MKKLLSLLLSVMMVMSVLTAVPFTVSAIENEVSTTAATCGDYSYKVLEDNTAEITTYNGSATNLEIPSTLDGYTVTSIGDSAFYYCKTLESVTIGNSVESIGERAFFCCEKLETISIPDSVKTIGDCAFDTCIVLNSVELGNCVESIGDWAFSGCISLESFTIPASVTSIGIGVLSFCENLAEISVSDGNSVFDDRNDCNVIVETDTNTLVVGCCETVIPQTVTYIGDYAFYGCEDCESISIPDSIIGIGNMAFCYCENLLSVTIGDSVASIGEDVFSYCTNLSSINVSENNSVYDSRNSCNAIIETATNELVIGCYNTTIPSTVTSIGYCAFFGCRKLESITIPDSVISIGTSAFNQCSNLVSVVISDSVESIEDCAFLGCNNLSSVNFPNSVKSIGGYAFFDCEKLLSVTVPHTVDFIDEYAFGYITEREKVRGFKIYGYDNTEAERYANYYKNWFEFVSLGEVPTEKPDVALGDVDLDGSITVADVSVIQRYLAQIVELSDASLNVADTDKDGSITIADASRIQLFLAQIITEF